MSTFRTELKSNVLYVRFGQPDAHNLMGPSWFADLEQTLRAAGADSDVRCVHLSSEGKSFSSGGDLKAFLMGPQPGGSENAGLGKCMALFESFEKPIVAAVHGAAIGGGTTVLLHCDFVYAREDVRFQLPFTRLGIVPELGSSLLLPMHAGQRLASELLMLGRPFDAETALRAGIVNEVLGEGDMQARADEVARELASMPAASMRATKSLIKGAHRADFSRVWREECALLDKAFASPELKEACKAFLEKRKPDFSSFH